MIYLVLLLIINLYSPFIARSEGVEAEQENITCEVPNTCPVCEITTQWPIDFDRDDLAEKAELRKCDNEEIIIIYDSKNEPIIYKSNKLKCGEAKDIGYTRFDRIDFNNDKLDELLIVEHDKNTGDDNIKILQYNTSSNIIEEAELVEYKSELEDKLVDSTSTETDIKQKYNIINNNKGFNMSIFVAEKRFDINYYQDRKDRKFYPFFS